jgi:hypothetical protein
LVAPPTLCPAAQAGQANALRVSVQTAIHAESAAVER